MTSLELVIGNKNYSSWSMRPWIAMKVMDIPFKETMAPLNFESHNRHLLEHSPSKKVPVLNHDDLIIWDSLAILEYLAEQYPDKRLWPVDPSKRAHARSISNQMHSGFGDLRNECPMNLRRAPRAIDVSSGVKRDVAQIEQIWRSALEQSSGPFLFDEFTIADAMFAPVINRLFVYELTTDKTALAYCHTIMALPSWKEWAAAAHKETWVIKYAEV